MNRLKRISSLVLALVLVFGLLAPGASAVTANAAENETFYVEKTYINPLYEGIITEDDLVKPDRTLLYADNTNDEQYSSARKSGELIRDDLVARDQTIYVNSYCDFNSEETLNEDINDLIASVFDWALIHTGNPIEGDYLLWQIGGYEVSGSYGYTDTYIFADLCYTVTYYTDASQEEVMDDAVSQVITYLNVSDADNYTKLKAIYDFICDYVEYDYENLDDEDYMLKHTAYAALINQTAVCQGYALLLYRLALELGVDCRLIAGDSNGPHGWNIAEIDGLYYNLDSTWDAGSSDYSYFLVCPDNFPNHTRDSEYDTSAFHSSYPMADADYTGCVHTYQSEVTVPATCTATGVMTYTCSGCGYSYTEEIPMTRHIYEESTVTPPTCTAQGYTTFVCTTCGTYYRDNYTNSTGHHYDDGVVTQEPTCIHTGIRTYTCTTCGVSYTEEIPTGDHTYTDGACTVCGAADPDAPPKKFDIAGTNMTLGNSLAMNFFIDPADLDADESYYAIITKAYANGEDQDFIVDQTKWNQLDGGSDALLYVTLNVVAAKEMTDDVKVVIYNSKDEAVSNVYTDSVRAYTMRALEKEEAAESPNKAKLTMYVDMLNYGAAAQVRFEYDVNDLANSKLNEDQKDYATGSVIMVNQQEKGEGYVGMNLTLESNLLMNFFFNNIPDSHNDMYAVATFTNHYGKNVVVRINGKDFGQLKNDTKWYVPVTDVVVADCSQLVTVKVYNANGTVVASGVDSIESYIARAIDRDPQLYNAIMKFAVSAREALQ